LFFVFAGLFFNFLPCAGGDGLRQQWLDNNLTYLDAELLELYIEDDHDYMTITWPEYHHKHACRHGICPNYLFDHDKDKFGGGGGGSN